MTTKGPGDKPDRIEIGLDDLKNVPDPPRPAPGVSPGGTTGAAPRGNLPVPAPRMPPPAFAPPAQYPSGPAYGVPVYGVPQESTNGMAIASLVLGIVSLCGVGSILALIFGYSARRQIRETGGRQGGGGMAIAGIVLGWVGLAIVIIYLIFVAAIFGTASQYGN